jgi:hypothetical protein
MGLENIMEEGDAETIELCHSSFNAVLCRWGSRQDKIWNAVTEATKKYSDNSGHVKLSNEAICIAGRK